MLPTRNLFEHEQADLVATIEEMSRLRVVRGADDIAMEVLAKDVGIFALYAARHCLTDEGKCLMAVESAEFDDLAIQRETVISEHRFAEPDTPRVFINNLAPRVRRT